MSSAVEIRITWTLKPLADEASRIMREDGVASPHAAIEMGRVNFGLPYEALSVADVGIIMVLMMDNLDEDL